MKTAAPLKLQVVPLRGEPHTAISAVKTAAPLKQKDVFRQRIIAVAISAVKTAAPLKQQACEAGQLPGDNHLRGEDRGPVEAGLARHPRNPLWEPSPR